MKKLINAIKGITKKDYIIIVSCFVLGVLLAFLTRISSNFIDGYFFRVDYFLIILLIISIEIGSLRAGLPFLIGGYLVEIYHIRLFTPTIEYLILYLIIIILVGCLTRLLNKSKMNKYKGVVGIVILSIVVYILVYPLFFQLDFPTDTFGYKELLFENLGLLYGIGILFLTYLIFLISEVSGLFDGIKAYGNKKNEYLESTEETEKRIRKEVLEDIKKEQETNKNR